jgi:hypothetical protein
MACRHASEVFQAAEHPLDGVPVATGEGREAAFPFAIGLGRNVWRRAPAFDLPADRICVMALVGVRNVAFRQLFKERSSRCAVGDLATRRREGQRSAICVGQGVDFGRATAERCAFTAVQSMGTSAGGTPA